MTDSVTRLQDFMTEQGLSRKELAAALGYDVVHLHKLFCGAVPMTEKFVGKFFLAYGPEATARVFPPEAKLAEVSA